MKVVLLGAGNVATHLGIALQKAKHAVVQVYSRNERSAKELSKKLSCGFTTDIKKISNEAGIYIIAIKDDEIKNLSLPLSKREGMKNKILVHTSGSLPMNIFRNTSQINVGVFYPLQTFSKNRAIDLSNIPICIEANNKPTEKKLLALARTISKNVHIINSGKRKTLHVAAVFANNFTNHLYAVAEDILKKEKLSFDILKPLIQETVDKIKNSSPSKMQTGPAIRGDKKIIKEHLSFLSSSPLHRKIYKLLTESINKARE